MKDIMVMIVVATISYAIYRLFELYARRRERLAVIEKISEGIDPDVLKGSFNCTTANKGIINNQAGSWAIRIGLLLVGVGLGVALAAIIDLLVVAPSGIDGRVFHEFRNTVSILYPAFAAIFGGTGLIIAYFIERKEYRKERNELDE
jgi:hypothetical protein